MAPISAGSDTIDVWIDPAAATGPLREAFSYRLGGGAAPDIGAETIQALCLSLPVFQRALSFRGTPYARAILCAGCGFGENCRARMEQLVAGQGLSIDGTHPPLGLAFDGAAPALLCELAAAVWRRVVAGIADTFAPNGMLRDDAAIAAAVDGQLASWAVGITSAAGPGAGTEALLQAAAASLRSDRCDEGGVTDAALSRLLGLRLTPGSVEAVKRGVAPVGLPALFAAFEVPQVVAVGQVMTVGSRALAKHCQRDETASWWLPGPMCGTQPERNVMGLAALARVLRDNAWANVHMLPHDIVTYELRCSAGYGARWVMQLPSAAETAEDGDDPHHHHRPHLAPSAVFRGFLEPQDPDGHSKGWHH
jgi:hypothetical protein